MPNTFETLPTSRNWGGYDEEYPNEQAIQKAKKIAALAETLGYGISEVRPDALGGVCLEWDKQEDEFFVYCFNHLAEHHTESKFKYMIGIDIKNNEECCYHKEATTPTEVITELVSFFRLPYWSL